MHSLETDLHYLGVLDKTVAIAQELGSAAAVRYVRSSYQLLSKGYRPGLHNNQAAAEEGQKRLNAIKERLDWTSDEELARFLGASTRPADGHPLVMVVEDEQTLTVRALRGRDPNLKALFISVFFGTHSIRGDLMDEVSRFGYPMLAKPFKPSQLFTLVR